MRRGWFVRVAAGCLLTAAPIVGLAACSSGEQTLKDTDKVTICHATSSAKNAYVQEQPNVDGVLSGHDAHPDDIIPTFTYIDNSGKRVSYPGKNWDAQGQAILKNRCGKANGNQTESTSSQAPTPTTAPPTSATPTSETTSTEVAAATTTTISQDALTTTTTGGAAIAPPTTTGGGGTAAPDTSVVPGSPVSPAPSGPGPAQEPTSPTSPAPSGAASAEAGQNNAGTLGQASAGTSGDQTAAGAQPAPAPAQQGQPSQTPGSSAPQGGAAAPPSSTAPTLSNTGFPTVWTALLGLLLLTAGILVRLIARKTAIRHTGLEPPLHADSSEPA